MKIFKLPDLGEGLVEAEIREWHVAPGDRVAEDDLLASVETAKAVVDIPSPQAGRVEQCYGQVGDLVQVGDPLVEFERETVTDAESAPEPEPGRRTDSGSVVGQVEVGGRVLEEPPAPLSPSGFGARATPAVRALAHRLGVDLSVVTPSGPSGTVSAADVQRVARIFAEVGPMERLRGVRRTMAVNLAKADAEVVRVTLSDDADIESWIEGGDLTIRLVRAIVAGCRAEPALNAWYDAHSIGRRLLTDVHLGIAVDSDEGLFVPVLRQVDRKEPAELRQELDALKAQVRNRSVPAEALRGQTFVLSNFGRFAGRYADPIVVPPTVAILGAGRVRREPVAGPEKDTIDTHARLPLSLSFDHRAVTGGEASRFLGTLIADLQSRN